MPQKPDLERPSDCSTPTTLHEELNPDLGPGHPTPEPAGVLSAMVTDLAESQKVLDIDRIAAELGVIALRREAVAREHGVCYLAKPSLANLSFSLLPFDPWVSLPMFSRAAQNRNPLLSPKRNSDLDRTIQCLRAGLSGPD